MTSSTHLSSPDSEPAKTLSPHQQYSLSVQSLFSDSDGDFDNAETPESGLFSDENSFDVITSSEFSYLLRILSVHLFPVLDGGVQKHSDGKEVTSTFKHYRSFRIYSILQNKASKKEKVEVFSGFVRFGKATTCLFDSDESPTSLHVRDFPVVFPELKSALSKKQKTYAYPQLCPLVLEDGHYEISILDSLEITEGQLARAETLLHSQLDSLFTLASRHAELVIRFFCNSCERISAAASEIAMLIQMTQGTKTAIDAIDYCLDFCSPKNPNLSPLVTFLESTMTVCTQIEERIRTLLADVILLRAFFENFGDSFYTLLDQTSSIFERLDAIYMEYVRCDEKINDSHILFNCYSLYCDQVQWLSTFSSQLSLSKILADLLRVSTDSSRLLLLLPDIMEQSMHLRESIDTKEALEGQIL